MSLLYYKVKEKKKVYINTEITVRIIPTKVLLKTTTKKTSIGY